MVSRTVDCPRWLYSACQIVHDTPNRAPCHAPSQEELDRLERKLKIATRKKKKDKIDKLRRKIAALRDGTISQAVSDAESDASDWCVYPSPLPCHGVPFAFAVSRRTTTTKHPLSPPPPQSTLTPHAVSRKV